jgi:hypothetical protein
MRLAVGEVEVTQDRDLRHRSMASGLGGDGRDP